MKKKILSFFLVLACMMLVLCGCSGDKSRISTQTLNSQADEYIAKCRAEGRLDELARYWLYHYDEGKTFDFDSLKGENGTIKVAVKIYQPFVILTDGKYTGLTMELLYDFCNEYGYACEFMDVANANAVLMAVTEGKCDMAATAVSITEERKQSVNFSLPFYDNLFAVVTLDNNASDYKQMSDLEGKKTGAITGSVFPDFIKQNVNNANIYEYNETADALLALQSGKIDAYLGDLPEVTVALKEFPGTGIAFTVDADNHYGLVFPKTDAGGASVWDSLKNSFTQTFIKDSRWKLFTDGILVTLLITSASILLGGALGFGIFLSFRHGNKAAVKISDIFYSIVGGFPEVVLLMIFYYIVFGSVNISGVIVSIIVFTIIFSASVFSMISTSVSAIDKGQYEASYALGYTENETFFRMILPQAALTFWPQFKSAIKSLIKGTAIVGYVAVQDLTKAGDIIRSTTYQAIFPLLSVALLYFLMILLILRLIDAIDSVTKPSRKKTDRYLKGVDCHD